MDNLKREQATSAPKEKSMGDALFMEYQEEDKKQSDLIKEQKR